MGDRPTPCPGRAWPRAVALLAGVVIGAAGMWAFVGPGSFYDAVATFPPPNVHFVRDLGAFQVGLGAVLLLATVWSDALAASLAGVAVGSGFHLAGHIIDRGRGGNPVLDIAALAVLTAVLAAAAVWRGRQVGR